MQPYCRYLQKVRRKSRIALATIFLVKGLLIVSMTSCYMYTQLTQLETNAGPNMMGNTVVDSEVKACLKKEENQCHFYPCEDQNGATKEIVAPSPFFGYAGNFVHRSTNITKPHSLGSLGDTGWASGCILSDEYKFVFIHVLKSGGTGVKEFIKESLCGNCIDNPNPLMRRCQHVPKTLVRAEGCIKSIRDHQDYFHFSFVRNPFSRLYSAYSMMDGFPPANGLRGRLPTKDFSFSDFVMKPNKRELHSSIWPGHYDSQESFLFSQEDQCPVFDFLGRLEHFDVDMRRILIHLNATKMLDYLDATGGKVMPANSWGARKKKRVGGDLQKEYSTPQIVDRVASQYRQDFKLLGYNANDVPQN